MRKRKLTLLEGALIAAPIVVLIGVALPVELMSPDNLAQRQGKVFRRDVFDERLDVLRIFRARENGHYQTCPSNLKQIGLGIMQYMQDYDDRYPPPASSDAFYGWGDMLQPYVKSVQLFQCPSDAGGSSNNPKKKGYTDYWYNRNLSGVWESNITSTAQTLLLGDGNDGSDLTDARYSQSALPSNWLTNHSQPPWRHLTHEVWAEGGAYYAFADGHVKWLKPSRMSNALGQSYNFVVK